MVKYKNHSFPCQIHGYYIILLLTINYFKKTQRKKFCITSDTTTDFNYLAIQKSNNFTQCYTIFAISFKQVVMVMSMPEPITHCMMLLQNHIRTFVQEFQFLTNLWLKTEKPATRF